MCRAQGLFITISVALFVSNGAFIGIPRTEENNDTFSVGKEEFVFSSSSKHFGCCQNETMPYCTGSYLGLYKKNLIFILKVNVSMMNAKDLVILWKLKSMAMKLWVVLK